MNYYYLKNDEVYGPFNEEQLRVIYSRGEISLETQVCNENVEHWYKLAELGIVEIQGGQQPTPVGKGSAARTQIPPTPEPVRSLPVAPPIPPPLKQKKPTANELVKDRQILIVLSVAFVFLLLNQALPSLKGLLFRTEWEYKIVSVPDSDFPNEINKIGSSGWELVYARRASDSNRERLTFSYEMIFKRKK